MEKAVEHLEEKMKITDQRLDNLVCQVGNIENDIIFTDNDDCCAEIEVNNLLKSVNQVKTNYQNLRKDLMEVQVLQKQLSTSLQLQLRLMQTKFNHLKEKINSNQTTTTTTTTQEQNGTGSTTTTTKLRKN